MNLSILIVNYNKYNPINNPVEYDYMNKTLTITINSIIANIQKHIKYDIYVIDNSDYSVYKPTQQCVQVLSNANGKLFNLKNITSELCVKNHNKTFEQCLVEKSLFGISFNHAYSIQWFIDNFNCDNLLLCDSDICFIKEIDFINTSFITAGHIQILRDVEYKKNMGMIEHRIFPHCQYLNIKMMKENYVKFLDINRMLDVTQYWQYDTGSSFLEDIRKREFPVLEIYFPTYCWHFSEASYVDNNKESKNKFLHWFEMFSKYL